MTAATFDEIASRIDGSRDRMISLQADLTAIPALGPENDGEGELKKAEFLQQFLSAWPFKVERYDCPDDRVPSGIRPNISARIPGKDNSRRVWILTHLDIVPPGESSLWKSDPYKLRIEEDRIYGRGVEDNQQALVASVFAACALFEAGVVPQYEVCLGFVADEETGSEFGLGYLLREHRELFSPDDLILAPDAGQPSGDAIEVAEKSILWLRFRTVGAQCHASTPQKGNNAFRAASRLVVRLDELHRAFDARVDMFDPPISTFEPTKKEANVPNVNTIPGDDVFYLDCRVLPQYPVDDVLGRINGIIRDIEQECGVKIETSEAQRGDAAPPTSPDAPVVKALTRGIKAVYGIDARPIGIGGGTVAALLRREGLPVAAWSKLNEVAHQPNEYCVIDNMVGDAKVFAHVMIHGA